MTGKYYFVLTDTYVYPDPKIDKFVPNSILKLGDVVEISQRSHGNWVKLSSPIEGWVEIYRTIEIETQTNANQSQQNSVQLIPFDLLNHSCHGSIRPFGRCFFHF